ncbi:MAG: cell wall metabolism sensor histidine kinase WalK [Lachnospiraceae bacterium]|nr:cell wall metabolism sensor histidine kinase WalK [Lachnospiraceae bacterium]
MKNDAKKKHTGIFLRVFGYYVAVVLLFALALGFIFISLFNNSNKEHKRAQIEKMAETASKRMRQYILDSDYAEAMSYIEIFNEQEGADIWTISNPDAENPMNSMLESVNIRDVQLQPEFTNLLKAAYSGEDRLEFFYSNIHGSTAMAIGVPIRGQSNEVCGALIIIMSMEELDENIATGIKLIVISSIIALMLATIIAMLFARQLVKPIMRIKKVTTALSEGDYSTKTEIIRADEIGEVAESIDKLAEKLCENDEERKNMEQTRLDFFANVSHEMRTPIAVVRAYTESLVDGVVTDEEKVSQYYARILAECKSMERLVGDLLTLSKMQNPAFKIEKEPVNLVHIFDEIVRSALALSNEKGIQIVMHRESSVYMIMGDYDRLRQMFIVILDNAIKFSESGSSIYLTLTSEKRKIVCSIRDEGAGISDEELPNIFDKFYKSKLRQNAKGTGLGLPIAKYICLKHDGSIEVKSKVGEGTEFIFTFDEVFEEDL